MVLNIVCVKGFITQHLEEAALHFLEQCSGSNDLSLQTCYRASRVSVFSPPPGLLYPYIRTIEKFIKHLPFCHCFL